MLQKRGYAVIGALRGNFYGLMGRQVVKWEEPPPHEKVVWDFVQKKA